MTHQDTWGAPSEGWPSFDENGKRIRTPADEFVDRVFGECSEDYMAYGVQTVKDILGKPDPLPGAGFYGEPIPQDELAGVPF